MKKRLLFIQLPGILFFLSVLLFMIFPWLNGSDTQKHTIVVYGFSTLEETMTEGIFPAFTNKWKEETGEKVEFISSFSGSGTVVNQILMGAPAEIAILSMEPDAYRLAEKKVIEKDSWKKLPYEGVLNLTPFVILVRTGNPKKISGFESLTRNGIEIVHPDPLTSGGAQWAILAEYGSALLSEGKQKAYEQLKGIWRNVSAQAASARAARSQFNNGFGDALITYEQEILQDKMKNPVPGEIIYPRSTILSQHIVAVINKNISASQKQVINAFTDFLWSNDAQNIFMKYGFRSVIKKLNSGRNFGLIEKAFYVNDLDGWGNAKRIINEIWSAGVLTDLRK